MSDGYTIGALTRRAARFPCCLLGAPAAIIVIATILLGCQSSRPSATASATASTAEFHANPYRALSLDLVDRPFNHSVVMPLESGRPVDDDGVPLFKAADGKLYYHPVLIAQEVLRLLDSYASGGGEQYLTAARTDVDVLLKQAVTSQGALFFPYAFDTALHGNPQDMMKAPWYSAMAQGEMLSALVRLFDATGDDHYSKSADEVFASFLVSRGAPDANQPWTVFVDEAGYLWLEEYAKDPPMRVLNGHLFAMFGLYDYIQLTHSAAALRLYQGALTTVAHYGPEFRQPGGLSLYCLRVRVAGAKYHAIHIVELRYASAMSGDDAFSKLADEFAADSPPIDLPETALP